MAETKPHASLKKYLTIPCPQCSARIDFYCESDSVWIHYGRMKEWIDRELAKFDETYRGRVR